MKKRVLSFLLAVLMMASVLPLSLLSVSADGTGATENDGADGTAAPSYSSYRDLYVKGGMTALFVGYQSDASVSSKTAAAPGRTWSRAVRTPRSWVTSQA